MISLNFTRTELELLLKAFDIAEKAGWPTGDDKVRVSTMKTQIEKKVAELNKDRWQGFNK